jgi:hypothetical protein
MEFLMKRLVFCAVAAFAVAAIGFCAFDVAVAFAQVAATVPAPADPPIDLSFLQKLLGPRLGDYIGIAAAVVTVASMLANLTATEADNRIVGIVKRVLDFLALNWRRPA